MAAMLLVGLLMLGASRTAWAESNGDAGSAQAAGQDAQSEREQGEAVVADGVEPWLADVDWRELEAVLQGLPEEVRRLWSAYDLRSLTREIALSGSDGAAREPDAARDVLLPMIGRLAREACARMAGVAATLIGLSLIGGLAGALAPEKKDGVQEAAAFVCRCFTLTVVLSSFAASAKLAVACVGGVCACMELTTPILMTLLTAMGGTASAGVFQPAMSLLIGGVSASMESVVLPLIVCGGVLSLLTGLSPRVRLGELGDLSRRAVKWIIGAVTTLYTSITALRGMTAASYDGIAVRAAKYAAGSMFPMVGGLVSGSFDTVLGCAGLVKNAAGVTAILLCASIAAAPLLQIGAAMLVMRVTAAAIEPVAQKEQVAMCRTGAEMLASLLAACAAVAAMFLVTIGLIVGVGNAGIAG